jgi:hypothetical protein
MAISPKWRWLVVGCTFVWWVPCLIMSVATGVKLCLVYPFLGFYPGSTEGPGPGYSVFAMTAWGWFWLTIYVTVGAVALWKNSRKLAKACVIFINVSSLLVIARAAWDIMDLTHLFHS